MLTDTTVMRDIYGARLVCGDTVTALKPKKTGHVPAFVGCVAALGHLNGRMSALVQPHGGGQAQWVGSELLEAVTVIPAVLDGVLAEWM
jgi:hypothetical protein